MEHASSFVPDVGDLFFVEKRPMLVDQCEVFNRATGKLVTQRQFKYDHSQRTIIHRCTSRDKYVLVGTTDASQTNRHMYVIKDSDFYPISPDILGDLGIGVDGHPLRVDCPSPEEMVPIPELVKIKEGIENGTT